MKTVKQYYWIKREHSFPQHAAEPQLLDVGGQEMVGSGLGVRVESQIHFLAFK